MANGILVASQIEMLSQDGTGIMTIVPPATDTNQTLTLPDSTGTVATLGTSLTLATAVTASGTSVDFTSIPSWVKRITVMFSAVSTNGSSLPLLQIGDAGGVENTGYVCLINGPGSGVSSGTSTAGVLLNVAGNAAYVLTGQFTISQISGNSYVVSGITTTDSSSGNYVNLFAGRKTLSDTLTQVRITTVNGTDTFDAGTINIMYEG
jgi:hypothetical protein